MERKIYPSLISIALTETCNNRCIYCFAEAEKTHGEHQLGDSIESTKHASIELIKKVIERTLKETTRRHLVFTGGEPTLSPYFFTAIKEAKQNGLNISIITNGRKLSDENFCYRVVASGANSVMVSFESYDKRIHDIQVGCKGAWEETLQGIKNLVKFQNVNPKFNFFVNITATRINLPTILPTIEFLIQLGVEEIAINSCIPAGRGRKNLDLILSRKEMAELLYSAKELCEVYGVVFKALNTLPVCLFDANVLGFHDYSCIAGRHYCIRPNGDVVICDFLPDEIIGNIWKDSFIDMWNHPRMIWYRKRRYTPPRCRKCEKLEYCGSLCPALARAGGYKEIYSEDPVLY